MTIVGAGLKIYGAESIVYFPWNLILTWFSCFVTSTWLFGFWDLFLQRSPGYSKASV